MLTSQFSYESLTAAPDQTRIVRELEIELTRRLRLSADPTIEGYRLVEELRQLGHDLWSFDESTDFQTWCGDWVSPKQPFELIVELRYGEDHPPDARVTFRERDR